MQVTIKYTFEAWGDGNRCGTCGIRIATNRTWCPYMPKTTDNESIPWYQGYRTADCLAAEVDE